jgi:hypothetical protein
MADGSDARSELVRIDTRGEVHPIGAKASQRLRSRPGAYRVLPAPNHVVFLRYTGEDGLRDKEDGAVVRLAGEVTRPGGLCDIVGLLGQAGWRGELLVMDSAATRRLFFDRGNIVGVQTNAEHERLGQVMYRFGDITEAQLQKLESELARSRRPIGELVVELGFVGQSEVFRALRKQVDEVVSGLLSVDDGTFFFLEGFDDSALISHQVVSVSAALMDAVQRVDEIKYFRERIPSGEHIPRRSPGSIGPVPAELENTYWAINGVASIAELGRMTGRGEFALTKDVFTLLRHGTIYLSPPSTAGSNQAIVALVNDALKWLHALVDEAGRGGPFRETLSAFTTGAGLYDVLFRRAGPARDGTLVVDAVCGNSELVDAVDPAMTLRRMLHEYLAFALFSAHPLLSADKRVECEQKVSGVLAELQSSV